MLNFEDIYSVSTLLPVWFLTRMNQLSFEHLYECIGILLPAYTTCIECDRHWSTLGYNQVFFEFLGKRKKLTPCSERQTIATAKWKKQEKLTKIENPLWFSFTVSTIPPVFLWINFQGHRVSANISFPKMAITQAITWTTQILSFVKGKGGKRWKVYRNWKMTEIILYLFFSSVNIRKEQSWKSKE